MPVFKVTASARAFRRCVARAQRTPTRMPMPSAMPTWSRYAARAAGGRTARPVRDGPALRPPRAARPSASFFFLLPNRPPERADVGPEGCPRSVAPKIIFDGCLRWISRFPPSKIGPGIDLTLGRPRTARVARRPLLRLYIGSTSASRTARLSREYVHAGTPNDRLVESVPAVLYWLL